MTLVNSLPANIFRFHVLSRIFFKEHQNIFEVTQIQLPAGLKERLEQQLMKLPPHQQELFKKNQPKVMLRLHQQLVQQQRGGPVSGITKIPITINVSACCPSSDNTCSLISYNTVTSVLCNASLFHHLNTNCDAPMTFCRL